MTLRGGLIVHIRYKTLQHKLLIGSPLWVSISSFPCWIKHVTSPLSLWHVAKLFQRIIILLPNHTTPYGWKVKMLHYPLLPRCSSMKLQNLDRLRCLWKWTFVTTTFFWSLGICLRWLIWKKKTSKAWKKAVDGGDQGRRVTSVKSNGRESTCNVASPEARNCFHRPQTSSRQTQISLKSEMIHWCQRSMRQGHLSITLLCFIYGLWIGHRASLFSHIHTRLGKWCMRGFSQSSL